MTNILNQLQGFFIRNSQRRWNQKQDLNLLQRFLELKFESKTGDLSISFEFELISLEESIKNRPERAIDQEIKQFKEFIKERRIFWTKDEKIELETDKFDNDESLENNKCI